MNLLIYSNPKEPVSDILLRRKNQFGIECVSIEEILNEKVVIFDQIRDGVPKLQWTFTNGKQITNSTETFLINRVFECPVEMFDDFSEEDKLYAQNEFYAYLMFALYAFPNKTNAPGPYNLSGGFCPLPKMWDLVNAHIPNLKTPEFYLGNRRFLPEEWNATKDIVYSQLYDYYFWKLNEKYENVSHVFAFKRPFGNPWLVLIIGDQVTVHHMDNSSPERLSDVVEERIIGLAKQINGLFSYPFADLLFFINDEEITFGMIHNVPLAGSRTENFESQILRWCCNHLEQKSV